MSPSWGKRTFAGWVARRTDPELAAVVEAWPGLPVRRTGWMPMRSIR